MIRKIYWNDGGALDQIMQELRLNRVFIGTTDTVPGLFASLSVDGFEGLNAIKGRTNKPYLVLINDKEKSLLFSSDGARPEIARLMEACWPGPLTLILRAREGIPTYLQGTEGTIALRVPNRSPLLQLLAQVEGLFSTSANYAGSPTPSTIKDADTRLIEAVSLVVDDHEASALPMQASTIVDCTGSVLRIVREGSYSRESLKKWGVQ